jgi:hypothetical protein
MPAFHVADLSAQGELELRAEYLYQDLEQLPGAADLIGIFSGQLWQNPGKDWSVSLFPYNLRVRLTSPAQSSAIATVWERDRDNEHLLSISLLLTGKNPDADQLTLRALQTHLLRELHGTPFEAGFALMQLNERPMVASVHLGLPQNPDASGAFAIADRCLAAAFFRYQGLA